MESVRSAAELLRQTEGKLRGLVSEAAASGDYASVVQIAAWARTVCELIKPVPGDDKIRRVTHPKPPKKAKRTAAGTPTSNKSRRTEPAYPWFFRQGDQLTRVAWSKREKKEYRHKAPYSTLKALATAMSEKGAEGRVFSTDEFVPIHDADGGDVPNYQAYVGISLLKQTGLIDQHGRQGYSIPQIAEFKEAVEAIWKKLPTSKNFGGAKQ